MEDRNKLLWQGARPLIGTVVGVGIFGLPYVFSQTGYLLGLAELVFVALLSLVSYVIFADLLAINKSHVRFVEVIGHQLGPVGRWVATVAFLGGFWGALLAYIIVGGSFAFNVLHQVLAGSLFQYQVAFWLIASVFMIGGTLFVRRLQTILIPLFFVMIIGLVLFALPNMHVDYLTTLTPSKIMLPFGALIFAFGGFAAVPECRDALGRRTALMYPALALAVTLIAMLYALFTFGIMGMTGPFTSPQAVESLRLVTGPGLFLVVSMIGLAIVFTTYISAGNALMNSLIYDFRGRFLSSWWLTVIVPMCLLAIGIKDFIHVIGTTGGILGGVCGILLVIAYERARLTAQLPKRHFVVPQTLVALCFMMFLAMIVVTILELF